jgi:hypothetical protein
MALLIKKTLLLIKKTILLIILQIANLIMQIYIKIHQQLTEIKIMLKLQIKTKNTDTQKMQLLSVTKVRIPASSFWMFLVSKSTHTLWIQIIAG